MLLERENPHWSRQGSSQMKILKRVDLRLFFFLICDIPHQRYSCLDVTNTRRVALILLRRLILFNERITPDCVPHVSLH